MEDGTGKAPKQPALCAGTQVRNQDPEGTHQDSFDSLDLEALLHRTTFHLQLSDLDKLDCNRMPEFAATTCGGKSCAQKGVR